MRVMLLTEHQFEFLSLKGGCTARLVWVYTCQNDTLLDKILILSNRSFCSFKTACRIILFPYTQSNHNLLKHFCHFSYLFCARCGTNCINSWYLPSSLIFILTWVPTHKKYHILCYPLGSNSGWLPVRSAYFILLANSFQFDTYHISGQLKFWQAWASAQSC